MIGKRSALIRDYLIITLGAFCIAMAIVVFLEPHTIAPGGVTGLAILIKKLFGVSIDITNLVINIPLFIIGVMVLGKNFGIKTAYATVLLSVFIRLIYIKTNFSVDISDDVLLTTIYGGVLFGSGIGLVYRSGGTTGGTDLIGSILHKRFPQVSMPKLMMCMDIVIVISSGIVNRRIETTLYSIIALYVGVKMADFIVEGLNYAKEFTIISEEYEAIGKYIVEELHRSATMTQGAGLYTKRPKYVLMCVVNRPQVTKLKRKIAEIDPEAFITLNTVHEVVGEGFTREKKEGEMQVG